MSKPSIAETHPELAKQWHPTKNGELTPRFVTVGSNKKVWWKCDEADDHEWESSVKMRTRGRDCPCCRGKKVVVSNCLQTTNPDLAKDWHPTKNGDLTPFDIVSGSNKKVWWKCDKADDHEWETKVNYRKSGQGCPCCSGNKLVTSNSLLSIYPELAKEWHSTKNGTLLPQNIYARSGKNVWWKCEKGDDHEWQSKVKDRAAGNGCPICRGLKVVKSNSLLYLNPELAKEWHPIKNKIEPSQVSLFSHEKVWWKCSEGDDHEWISRVADRTNGNGCPICSGHKVAQSSSLAIKNPEIAKEWHPTKNGNFTPLDFTPFAHKQIWWKCPVADDHAWRAKISDRHKGNCPMCVGRTVVLSNCLQTTHPDLAKQWHPTKNGKLTPMDVTYGSKTKVWWKCDKGDDHEWKASSNQRANNGCPCCSGRKLVLSNCLQMVYPTIAKEWHPNKNGDLTPYDIVSGSNKKVWWKCSKDNSHEWQSKPNSRVGRGDSCPYCTLTPQSRQELIITFELKTIFKNINPKGFKTILDGRLRAIDIFIPLLKLAIEFDGSFWHKDKKAIDKIKSEMLMDEGYKVIRIREEPLKKIHENDIVSTHPYNGKEITDNIIKRILATYDIFKIPMLNKIYEYLKKDGLQNEKGLDRYIDQILTEKAEKREQLH